MGVNACLEVTDESLSWLDLLGETEIVKADVLKPPTGEAQEPVALFVASLNTATGSNECCSVGRFLKLQSTMGGGTEMTAQNLAILLVEDDPRDVELTLRAFSRRRLSNPIHVARDGEEALDYVHRRGAFAAGAPVPGLILLDIRLSKVDGVEVLRQMKAHPTYRTIPVVMLTISREETDIRRCYELGANSYILKPVDFEKFLDVVERIELYWLLTNVPPPLE